MHDPFGQRPGLIQAHGIHAGKNLDGRLLLDQHLFTPQRQRRHRKRNGGHQRQALGDHGGNARDRGNQCGVEAAVVNDLLPTAECFDLSPGHNGNQWNQGYGDPAGDLIQPTAQF